MEMKRVYVIFMLPFKIKLLAQNKFTFFPVPKNPLEGMLEIV